MLTPRPLAHRARCLRRCWLWLALSAALLAACGSPENETVMVRVLGDSHSFSAPALIVSPGTTVVWHNQDHRVHTVTNLREAAANPAHAQAPDGAARFDSDLILAGHYWSHTFDAPGEYTYFCRFHEQQQMIGSIVVR